MLQCRYSVAQAIQRNWQAYLCILNKQQFFGIFRKGHYSSIFKELSTRMVQQNAWVVLLFNGKVGDVNIIQWFWLKIVMMSPGTHLVKNIESHSRDIESQIKKIYVCNWKCLGLCVTRQLIWLISLTDSKTLYYCSTLKSKYSASF